MIEDVTRFIAARWAFPRTTVDPEGLAAVSAATGLPPHLIIRHATDALSERTGAPGFLGNISIRLMIGNRLVAVTGNGSLDSCHLTMSSAPAPLLAGGGSGGAR